MSPIADAVTTNRQPDLKRFRQKLSLWLLGVLALAPHPWAFGQNLAYAFTNFAGKPGGSGNVDGIGSVARFSGPQSIAIDKAGNIWVADTDNRRIRRVTPEGSVSTLAVHGPDFDATGIAVDAAGAAYIADPGSHTIRKITPAGDLTTLAGSAGESGSNDGVGTAARFNSPRSLGLDGAGNVYVADSLNFTIRKVTSDGIVTTLAGAAGQVGTSDGTGSSARFGGGPRTCDFCERVVGPRGIAVDGAGNAYVADSGNHTIRRVTPGGIVTTIAGSAGVAGFIDRIGGNAQFSMPLGVAVDADKNIYVADSNNNAIRKVTADGAVTTLAGGPGLPAGSTDGTRSQAQFDHPSGLGVDGAGNIYAADTWNNTIRKIAPNGFVSTLAGSVGRGSADGTGAGARFWGPVGLAIDAADNLYVAEELNGTIRKITPAGDVTTLAGASRGGVSNGTGSAAGFLAPFAIATDRVGNVYVSDLTSSVRKITAEGVVTTVAGNLDGNVGSTDGPGEVARFYYPHGLAVGASGDIYVADTGNFTIRRISPGGTVTTLAGLAHQSGNSDGQGTIARLNSPQGIAITRSGEIYFADANGLRKITPEGVVTTVVAGLPAFYVALDSSDGVFVTGGDQIFRFTPDNTVTIVAGTTGVRGSADGIGPAAQFNYPSGIVIDSNGNLFVADRMNNRIAKGSPVPTFTNLTRKSRAFTSTLAGLTPGVTVVFQYSSNLRDWFALRTNIVTRGTVTLDSDIEATFPSAFFRALITR